MSQLEALPNELFVEIFPFLSTVDLLHGFLDLNDRLNQVIYLHFHNHPFSFQSIHKQHFDQIRHQHQSIFSTNISSLHLSNDEETPELCELFLLSGLSLDRFVHLQSLKLSHIDCFQTLNQLILKCRDLSCLQKLSFIDCSCINQQGRTYAVTLLDNVWGLPNLIQCVINNLKVNMTWICKVSAICKTLEYLSIGMIEGDKSALYHLCKSVSNIRRLNIDVIQWSNHRQPKIIFPTLIELKTAFRGLNEPTMEFLRDLPNLTSLTLEISKNVLSGNDWQTLLETSLPKLKIFRLKMNFSFIFNTNLITDMDRLVNSYRTPFWLEEHQWYIRCDCYLALSDHLAVLYTIPYAFDQCSYLNTYYSISTKPDDDQRYSHDRVYRVDPKFIRIDSMQNLEFFTIRFPNVHQMDIHFPWMDYSNMFHHLSFKQLRSLTVTLNGGFSYKQFQTFLHHTPRLYSLKITSFAKSIEGFFQLTSSSIRRLDLNVILGRYGLIWNHKDCMNLIRSPLGRQCEVLLISLENTKDILEIIEKMPHLRVLICRMRIENSLRWKTFSSRSTKLMQWLRKNLPPKCSIMIDSEQHLKISIWINRELTQSFSSNDQTSISTDRAHLKKHSSRTLLYLFVFFVLLILSCSLFIFSI